MPKIKEAVTDKPNAPVQPSLQEVLARATAGLGAAADKVRAAHGIRSTHIDHFGDGTHSVRHTPHDGQEYGYAVKNAKELGAKIAKELFSKEPENKAAETEEEAEPKG